MKPDIELVSTRFAVELMVEVSLTKAAEEPSLSCSDESRFVELASFAVEIIEDSIVDKLGVESRDDSSLIEVNVEI